MIQEKVSPWGPPKSLSSLCPYNQVLLGKHQKEMPFLPPTGAVLVGAEVGPLPLEPEPQHTAFCRLSYPRCGTRCNFPSILPPTGNDATLYSTVGSYWQIGLCWIILVLTKGALYLLVCSWGSWFQRTDKPSGLRWLSWAAQRQKWESSGKILKSNMQQSLEWAPKASGKILGIWAPGLTRQITSSKSLLGWSRWAARTRRDNWAANKPISWISESVEKKWELVKVKLS